MTPEDFEKQRQELLNDPDIKNYPNVFHLLNYPYKNPQFFDYVMHPFDGPFWADKSIYPYVDKIKVPVYVVGKCAHDFGGYWDVYKALTAPKRLWVKPHGDEERPWREDFEQIIRWYDYWLKGIDTGIMQEEPIKLYMTGINQYRYEKEWPVKNIDYTNV
jgi:predicted acyl esterase